MVHDLGEAESDGADMKKASSLRGWLIDPTKRSLTWVQCESVDAIRVLLQVEVLEPRSLGEGVTLWCDECGLLVDGQAYFVVGRGYAAQLIGGRAFAEIVENSDGDAADTVARAVRWPQDDHETIRAAEGMLNCTSVVSDEASRRRAAYARDLAQTRVAALDTEPAAPLPRSAT